ISGAVRTPFARLTGEAPAGATMVSTDRMLSGWNTGDRLVIPHTRHLTDPQRATYVPQWEGLQVGSANGAAGAVTPPLSLLYGGAGAFTPPLSFLQEGARDGNGVIPFLPHVANLTRNVIIRSATPAGLRGHVLFATRAEVDVRYALFKDLGRTMISPLDSATFS